MFWKFSEMIDLNIEDGWCQRYYKGKSLREPRQGKAETGWAAQSTIKTCGCVFMSLRRQCVASSSPYTYIKVKMVVKGKKRMKLCSIIVLQPVVLVKNSSLTNCLLSSTVYSVNLWVSQYAACSLATTFSSIVLKVVSFSAVLSCKHAAIQTTEWMLSRKRNRAQESENRKAAEEVTERKELKKLIL